MALAPVLESRPFAQIAMIQVVFVVVGQRSYQILREELAG
jgi:hypothetical protein